MLTKGVRIWLAYGIAAFLFALWLSVAVGALVAVAGETTMRRGLCFGVATGLIVGTIAGFILGGVAMEELSEK